MLRAVIETIPHELQRYPTIGDYFTKFDGTRVIHVSKMRSADHELLVAIHELIEQHLCKKSHIPEASIDVFDINFENDRERNEVDGEPGDDPRAPYNKQHVIASQCEREVARIIGINWRAYEKALGAL